MAATDEIQDLDPDHYRAVAVVVGEHGLQGTIRVLPLSDFAERFDALATVYFRRDNLMIGRDEVRQAKWAGKYLLVYLKKCRTREDAESLRGVELCVTEADSWVLPRDTYYTSDLIGFRALGDGRVIGELVAVHPGAQDILEFTGEHGEFMVPFVSHWVGMVDTTTRTFEILNWRSLLEPEEVSPCEPDGH